MRNKKKAERLVLTCTKSVAALEQFERENKEVLRRHLQLEERTSRAIFTLKEKLDMMIESGELDEECAFLNETIEVRVNPEAKAVNIFQTSRYKKRISK